MGANTSAPKGINESCDNNFQCKDWNNSVWQPGTNCCRFKGMNICQYKIQAKDNTYWCPSDATCPDGQSVKPVIGSNPDDDANDLYHKYVCRGGNLNDETTKKVIDKLAAQSENNPGLN